MPGQLIPRGPHTFLLRVSLGRNAAGTRRYLNRTVHGGRRDAERVLTQLLHERSTGTVAAPSRQTVAAYLDQWLPVVRARVRSRTGADYTALVGRYLRPALGQERLDRLTPLRIAQCYGALSARGLSARTVRFTHAVLRAALEEARTLGLLPRNPAGAVKLPRLVRREMRALSPEEAMRLLHAARGERWSALWALLLTTGLRPGEALALRWADLDLDQGRLRVQRVLVRVGGQGWSLEAPKTDRARRSVTLPAGLVVLLRQHRARQQTERLAAGPAYASDGFVFATRSGAPLEYRALVRRHFKPLLRAAGLPPLRPYDLRHSCATLLLTAGVHPKVVSERLGHASTTLTLDTYSHVLPDLQQEAATQLDALLFPAGPGAERRTAPAGSGRAPAAPRPRDR